MSGKRGVHRLRGARGGSVVSLAEREDGLRELMDDPDCDPVRLRRTLRRFWTVNHAVSRWGRIYRTQLRPALAAGSGRRRILDIGCGGGDVLRRLVRLARRDGFDVEGLGIDPDPVACAVAREGPRLPGVAFRKLGSRELAIAGERFDVVVSNHLLHHLDRASFDAVLVDSAALASRRSVHADIARSTTAYAAFAVLAAPVAPGTFLRIDGLRSIRRSYTRAELGARLPAGWRAEQPTAFRLLAVRDAAPVR
ncbi:methyltransferase domain-containing protein [Leucobacter allii]|uniref:methyltransferase domain-containing protein n=1 Tax=Leucobacter allii TaxID=2932247 RepID=UPI0021069F83|nr:methyltransferase domain-containing protein [Leucobacter allii]